MKNTFFGTVMRIKFMLLFIIASAPIQYSISNAVDLKFTSLKYGNGEIAFKLAVSDSLPGDLVNYIKKGVPISFEYKTELWKSRSGWIDKLLGSCGIIYRLRHDTWEDEYTIIAERPGMAIENRLKTEREAMDLVKSSGLLRMPLDDTSGRFYIVGKLIIKTMSLSNLKEVESWLKGGISGAKKPKIEDAPDKFGEFLFNSALKISGLKNISNEIQTPLFEIKNNEIIFANEQ